MEKGQEGMSREMDELDGGRLDAERQKGGYGLKEGASEKELEDDDDVGGQRDVQSSRTGRMLQA